MQGDKNGEDGDGDLDRKSHGSATRMGEGGSARKMLNDTPIRRKAFSPLAATKSLKKKRSLVAKIGRGDMVLGHPEELGDLN